MKKFFFLPALATAAISLTACTKDEVTKAVTPVGPSAPSTRISTEIDQLDDSKEYLLAIKSETEVGNAIGTPEPAYLLVRCDTKGDRDVFISTPTYNADNTNTFLRWNKGTARSESWYKGQGGDSFFARAPMSVLREAAEADELTFGWTPYQKVRTSVRFELKKHRNDLDTMRQVCGA